MASLLPFIHDLLPMIMPSSVHITKASELRESGSAQEEAPSFAQNDIVVNKCDKLCASNTLIYAASGSGILAIKPDVEADVERHELAPGDFAVIPAWTEHQMVNETDEEVLWIAIQSGPHPVVVDLTDWGGDQKE